MPKFTFDPYAEIAEYQKIGSVILVPSKLAGLFGPPSEADGYKVSGVYRFSSDSGQVLTLYDWKATSLFDEGMEEGEESSSPTPEEFWGNENPDTLHIGGGAGVDPADFKA